MTKVLTNREKLDQEIKTLDDDQVLEVLEYIAVMKSLRNQEIKQERASDTVCEWLYGHEGFHRQPLSDHQCDGVLIFPKPRRAMFH